jgi:DNA-binding MarR family transcriptional regulator
LTLATRAELIEESSQLMRDFMNYAVLFQDCIARAAGLTSSDLQALGVLVTQGPTSPGALAARTGITDGGAITLLIDRLERTGFATRARDQNDRRRVLVTPDLEQVGQRLGPLYAPVGRRWTTYLETLSVTELRICLDFLRAAVAINRDLVQTDSEP